MLFECLQTWNGRGVPDLMWPRTYANNNVELLGISIAQMLTCSFSECFRYSTVNVSNYPHIILNAIAKAKCFKMPVLLKDIVVTFRLEGILRK